MDLTSATVHQFYTFLLVFARVAGLMVAAPLLGNRAIPTQVKAGFALLFALAVTPLTEKLAGPVPISLLILGGQVIAESLLGLAVGYMARLLFASIEMAGHLVDTQMGFGIVNVLNPLSQEQDSVLSLLQYHLAVTLYLLANGHLMLLGALAKSFLTVGPGMASPSGAFGLSVVPMVHTMLMLGMKLAVPAAGVLFVVDVAFGLVARLVPQVNVFIVGTPAKIMVGLVTVAFLLPIFASVVGQIITGTGAGLGSLFAGAK